VIPFFAFPLAVRKVIYMTNSIENINSQLRRISSHPKHGIPDTPGVLTQQNLHRSGR
jgi:transposase-like protein